MTLVAWPRLASVAVNRTCCLPRCPLQGPGLGSGSDAGVPRRVPRPGRNPVPDPALADGPPAFAPAPSLPPEADPDSQVVLDWKGDPMVIRKGDKIPRGLF